MLLDLPGLFEQAFGYRSRAFDPQYNNSYGNNTTAVSSLGAPYYASDALGREYYMPVTIAYNTAEDGSGALQQWPLPYPVVAVSSRKLIVETPLTERRGTVKECIGMQDYEITIRGFIIGSDGGFPEEDITTLRTIYELNGTVSVSCPLTDIFLLRPGRKGSDQVVIRELKLPLIAGVKNVRPYELVLVSDEPFNLIIP